MPRVYILGAGASRFAGYPLALELWPFVRDRSSGDVLANQRRKAVVEEMDRILALYPPAVYDQPDLEALFTLLDLSVEMSDVIQVQHADWLIMRPKVVGMITDAFMNYQHDLQGYLISGKQPPGHVAVDRMATRKVLDAWAAKVIPGDVLISFNWDLLHETALLHVGNWHWSDGYGFRAQGGAPQCSATRLYKLHGSVNWVQDSERDEPPAILYRGAFFEDIEDDGDYMTEAGAWDQGRKSMIIPSYLKVLGSNRCLTRIWNKAAEALRTADEITVIGYRLRAADSLAHHLLLSSLLANPHHPSVEIVSPGGDTWDDLCSAANITRKRTRKTFEEWVAGDR